MRYSFPLPLTCSETAPCLLDYIKSLTSSNRIIALLQEYSFFSSPIYIL